MRYRDYTAQSNWGLNTGTNTGHTFGLRRRLTRALDAPKHLPVNRRIALNLTCLVAASLQFGCYNQAQDQQHLIERGTTVTGTVYKLNCGQHGQFWYEFTWNGKRRMGSNPYYAGFNCNDVRVGDSVVVHVDPMNPSVHTIADPRAVFEHERGFYFPVWAYPILGLPLMFMFYFLSTLPSRKEPLPAPTNQGPQRPKSDGH